jgi:hypothetical protein
VPQAAGPHKRDLPVPVIGISAARQQMLSRLPTYSTPLAARRWPRLRCGWSLPSAAPGIRPRAGSRGLLATADFHRTLQKGDRLGGTPRVHSGSGGSLGGLAGAQLASVRRKDAL